MRTVLCDEHRMFAEAFGWLLERHGHSVLGCAGIIQEAAAALSKAEESVERIDVIVMDPFLFDAHGTGPIAVMRSVAPATPIAVLTGVTDAAALQGVLEAGARGLAIKTESTQEVERMLRKTAGGSAGASLRRTVLSREALKILNGRSQRNGVDPPTPRELEVMKLLAGGASTKEIAASLNVRTATVRTHLRNLFPKMKVNSRLQLVAVAIREGLVDDSWADGGQ